ncbi:MAG: WbqC family protein [Pseudomonas oryzihabitans]
MTKVAIVQSNYIPWRGYFDLIRSADVFVLYDDVQFTRRDWRNRNLIRTPQGLHWLSIPVKNRGRYTQKIQDVEVSDRDWAAKHWQTISASYRKAAGFAAMGGPLEELYAQCQPLERLSDINQRLLGGINRLLGIPTPLIFSSSLPTVPGRTENLVNLCAALKADTYLSGPAAKVYLQHDLFEQRNIAVQYFDYAGYPAYPQVHGEFEPAVSVLDLLLNTGPTAATYLQRSAHD